MGGILIFQPRTAEDFRGRLSRAEEWFSREKALPLIGSIEEKEISLRRYGRRLGAAAAIADCREGWLASVGYWTHPRLSRSDDNAGLLDLLLRRGAPVFDELDGMYALAWYRRRERTLTVATDHLGRLHAFYAVTARGAVIATSAIAAARLFPSDPDPIAFNEMLATGSIFEDRSPFRDIHRITAASVYEFREGALTLARSKPEMLWDSSFLSKPHETVEKVADVLQESVGTLLRKRRAPLSDLTGGLDSRLLLGLMLRTGLKPHLTVTGTSDEPDVKVARGIADRIGLPIAIEDISPPDGSRLVFEDVLTAAALSEGGFDPVSYSLIERIHCAHAGQFDVSINGSGGELLRNYWWDKAHITGKNPGSVSEAAQRFTRGADIPRIVHRELQFEPGSHFAAVIARSLDRVGDLPAYAKLDHVYLFLRMQCWQGSIASATNQIWPAVSPYLQRGALEAVLSLSPQLRLGAKAMYQMMGLCSTALATYPLENGFPMLSPTVSNFWRFAPGFVRLPLWLYHKWRAARGPDRSVAVVVRSLFASGAVDYFRLEDMMSRSFLDEAAFARFIGEGRTTGNVSLSHIGRLIALESAYRCATGKA
jgi:hypothetical protein